ncbi:MAG: hypothetical protein GY714_20075 [Desulfobacterales bacterium]|nr:hypothetical protein [Desulfobacterales bacterium]
MEKKKRTAQLKSLLNWENEQDRLPTTQDLFNKQVSETLYLRETADKLWVVERVEVENDSVSMTSILLKHTTLIQLGLSILEAVKLTEDRL